MRLQEPATLSPRGALAGTCDALTIDGFLSAQGFERVFFAKVDVQGAEPHVLRGMERALNRGAVDFVFFEYCEHWSWMDRNGDDDDDDDDDDDNEGTGGHQLLLRRRQRRWHTLRDGVEWLAERGYDTFLVGKDDLVGPLHRFWDDDVLPSLHWSNYLAARRHDPSLYQLLRTYNLGLPVWELY